MSAAVLLALATPARGAETNPATDLVWHETAPDGSPIVHLHVFTTAGCPHCAEAHRFLADFAPREPWLRVHEHELTGSEENQRLYQRVARALGEEARFVPAFAFCGRMTVGFASPDVLTDSLRACRSQIAESGSASGPVDATEAPIDLPLLGRVDPGSVSLPLFTVLIAGLDAFNPCAFFVLLVLLSLLVHAHSRARIFLVGGVFVLFSGVFYFAFMAAWLNLFLLVGELRAITAVAGAIAVTMGALQAKEWLGAGGPSLSIPERARPSLFRRMRELIRTNSLPSVLLGAVTLAAAANSYEILCTAGFPLVFTRVLTLHELSTTGYYLYLAAYNVVYVIPLAVVVTVFGVTLGSRKLGEEEGRTLKLLSGLMLLGLGSVLLVKPVALQHPLVAVALLAAAVVATALLVFVRRRRRAT